MLNKSVQFDSSLFYGKSLLTVKLTRLSTDYPCLVILLKEDNDKFFVLGAEICDTTPENFLQIIVKYPSATDYAIYSNADKEHMKKLIDEKLQDNLFGTIISK